MKSKVVKIGCVSIALIAVGCINPVLSQGAKKSSLREIFRMGFEKTNDH